MLTKEVKTRYVLLYKDDYAMQTSRLCKCKPRHCKCETRLETWWGDMRLFLNLRSIAEWVIKKKKRNLWRPWRFRRQKWAVSSILLRSRSSIKSELNSFHPLDTIILTYIQIKPSIIRLKKNFKHYKLS